MVDAGSGSGISWTTGYSTQFSDKVTIYKTLVSVKAPEGVDDMQDAIDAISFSKHYPDPEDVQAADDIAAVFDKELVSHPDWRSVGLGFNLSMAETL